jgi:hypothetical protein
MGCIAPRATSRTAPADSMTRNLKERYELFIYYLVIFFYKTKVKGRIDPNLIHGVRSTSTLKQTRINIGMARDASDQELFLLTLE